MASNKKKHLVQEERFCIEKLLRQGKSFGEIARTLSRGLSTISEEVKMNGGRAVYTAQKAQRRAHLKQYWKKKGCNAVAQNTHVAHFVEKKLAQGWSPETISTRLRHQSGVGKASAKSIRKYIKKRSGLERSLFWNRVHMKTGRKRGLDIFCTDSERKSIAARPLLACFEYGHWEGDFIVSQHNTTVLLVLVEKYSRMVCMTLLPHRHNDLVNNAINDLLRGYTVKSLTLDNDIAFTKWRELEVLLRAPVYFCHPYASWEKGLVENMNRWIRVFIPKRANLAWCDMVYVRWVAAWLNHTPRQCLHGASSYEIFMQQEYQKSTVSLSVSLPSLRIWG